MHLAFYKVLRVPLRWGLLENWFPVMTLEILLQASISSSILCPWVVAGSALFGLFVGAIRGSPRDDGDGAAGPATFFMPPIRPSRRW